MRSAFGSEGFYGRAGKYCLKVKETADILLYGPGVS